MWQKNVRYLDYNAGAGLHPQVQHQLKEILGDPEFFAANPSSRHRLGQKMRHLLHRATNRVAGSFGDRVLAEQLLFTSSGTEANQTVIRSAMKTGAAVFIGSGEHSASYDLLHEATMSVGLLYEIPLLPTGRYDLGQVRNLLSADRSPIRKERDSKKVLLSLFWANNETGVLNDLSEIKNLLTDLRSQYPDVEFQLHLDGAQVWGKLQFDLMSTPADYVTFSSHKIGAPAGTGVVWSRKPQSLKALIVGTQAQGARGGTENWMGIFATGVAAETVANSTTLHEFQSETARVRDRFEAKLRENAIPITIWGSDVPRVSNTSRFSFNDFKTYENWVELLDFRGFAVSHGSACKSQVIEPSRVLLKMGATREAALNSIRVSFGPTSSTEDADDLVANLLELYQNKRKERL